MMTLAHRRNHSLRFETEFDEIQPYFVQSMDEEEFYESTTPSEDIWKKFQLLPTPPRSPGRDEIDDGFSPLITDTITSFHPAITEQLRLVSESLDDGLASPAPPTIFVGDINSNLIQDCMWSGLIEPSLDSEKDTSTSSKTVSSKDKSLPSKFQVTKSSKAPSSTTTTTDYGTGECVDPTAVFPYPLSDRMDLSPETPSDSEEEIDVVSVGDKQQKVSEITKIRITHNYSAPYSASLKRKSGLNLSLNTSSKKSKTEANIEEVKRVLQSMKTPSSSHPSSRSSSKYSSRQNSRTGSRNSSRASSDSEDIDKRASHNVLERKRRTDLKNSFMRLRENIPELECQERAAKVVILKKAVDYVEELQSDESSLQEEERILRRRNIMLLQKLRTLREDVLDL